MLSDKKSPFIPLLLRRKCNQISQSFYARQIYFPPLLFEHYIITFLKFNENQTHH
jgi:hypothetical protein